jgi:hypothetical protein
MEPKQSLITLSDIYNDPEMRHDPIGDAQDLSPDRSRERVPVVAKAYQA